tara:strand:+ start:1683 stop:3464 length:1782 start_codon:yes stop_codon:yes gene_type:complete
MAFKQKARNSTETYESFLDQSPISKESQDPQIWESDGYLGGLSYERFLGHRGALQGKRQTKSYVVSTGTPETDANFIKYAQGKVVTITTSVGLQITEFGNPISNTQYFHWNNLGLFNAAGGNQPHAGCLSVGSNLILVSGQDILSNPPQIPLLDLQGTLRSKVTPVFPMSTDFKWGNGNAIGNGIFAITSRFGDQSITHLWNGLSSPTWDNEGGTLEAYDVGNYNANFIPKSWRRSHSDGTFRWNHGDRFASVKGMGTETGAAYGGRHLAIGEGRVVVLSNDSNSTSRLEEDTYGTSSASDGNGIDYHMYIYTTTGALVRHVISPKAEGQPLGSAGTQWGKGGWRVQIGNGVIAVSHPTLDIFERDGKFSNHNDQQGLVRIYDLNGKYLGTTGHSFHTTISSGTYDSLGKMFDLGYGWFIGTMDQYTSSRPSYQVMWPFQTDTVSDLEQMHPIVFQNSSGQTQGGYLREFGVNGGSPTIMPGIAYHENFYDGQVVNSNLHSKFCLDFHWNSTYRNATAGQTSLTYPVSLQQSHFNFGFFGNQDQVFVGNGVLGKVTGTTQGVGSHSMLDNILPNYYEDKVKYTKYRLNKRNEY